jgi:branched-chain amino acid transport system permease protein
MDLTAVLGLQILTSIATLIMFSLGLAIVFGMMKVINLAHGEFLMIGAYSAVYSYNLGLNIWIGMVVVAPIVTGLYGFIAEYVLVRRLYGRLIDTLLATWGLSLFTAGLVAMIFGNTSKGVPMPLGTLTIGDFGIGAFNVFIIFATMLMLAVIYLVLRYTQLGVLARGTMQNAEMVAALGYNPRTIYAATFTVGAALTGLAGGLLAPLTGVIPTMGAAFVSKAFITVISGGSAIIVGTGSSAVVIGSVSQVVSFLSTPVIGEVALFLTAIILLRL